MQRSFIMKNNLRKNLFIFAIFALYAFSGFAAKTENSSYAEILSAYQSGFYPGVIKYAEKFQKSYRFYGETDKEYNFTAAF